jgi:hypothetical protein
VCRFCTELSEWLQGWAPSIDAQDAATLGAIGVNALLGKRATSTLFQAPGAVIPDEQYIAEWTATLASRIEALC